MIALVPQALAAAKVKEVSVWVNRGITPVKLNAAKNITVSLKSVDLNAQGGMTLILKLDGAKKHSGVTMTGVTVGGKAVKENRANGNVFTGYLYSDNGTAGLNVNNAKMEDLQFSLQIQPSGGKKYTVGPFKITFKGDFSASGKKVKIPFTDLSRFGSFTLANNSMCTIVLTGASVKLAFSSIHQEDRKCLVLQGYITSKAAENLDLSLKNVKINKQPFTGSVPSTTRVDNTEYFSLYFWEDKDSKLPAIEDIKSGSFNLYVSTWNTDYAAYIDQYNYACSLSVTTPKENPVALHIPKIQKSFKTPYPLIEENGLTVQLLGIAIDGYNGLLSVSINNQTEDTFFLMLNQVTLNGEPRERAYSSQDILYPGVNDTFLLQFFDQTQKETKASSIKQLRFYIMGIRQDWSEALYYIGPFEITVGK